MMIVAALIAAPTVVAPAGAAAAEPTIVATSGGALKGVASHSGRQWRAIPYAAPPIGELRWRPPAPPQRWQGLRDAHSNAPACLQDTTAYDTRRGSEDCLYLNVFAPPGRSGRLPVIVWLHGGGFVNGSGNDFDASRLARTARAVVVTVNYRLGPFGWLALDSLSHEQRGSSGNYGLLDQTAALRWVRANIAGFGGDPGNVTLSGQSAGGESVFAHLANTGERGLFHRAIVVSAPAGLSLPSLAQASARNESYPARLGCTDRHTQAACLRAVGPATALAAGKESWNLVKDLGLYWTPIVGVPSLPDQWLNRYARGQFNRVPVMVGHTAHEGRLFTAIYENDNGHPLTRAQFEERIHAFFSAAAPAIAALYDPGSYRSPASALSATITDALFACGAVRDLNALANNGVPALYSYEFADPDAPEVNVHGKFSAVADAHDSDLPSIFQYNPGRLGPKDPPFTTAQRSLARVIGRYWGNFVRTGNPNAPGLPSWPAYVSGVATPTQLLRPAATATSRPGQYFTAHRCEALIPMLVAKQQLPAQN